MGRFGLPQCQRPLDISKLDADDLLVVGDRRPRQCDGRRPYRRRGGRRRRRRRRPDRADGGTDDDVSAAITSYGPGEALLIEADGGDIAIGATASGFGVHVQGSLSANGVYGDVDATTLRIHGGRRDRVRSRFGRRPTVLTPAVNGSATAVLIGADAIVSNCLRARASSASSFRQRRGRARRSDRRG